MSSDGPWRELQHALDRHGLEAESGRLERERHDVEAVLEILLIAFGKTADSKFFALFYTLTHPLLLAEAKKTLKRLDLSGDPEEAVHQALKLIMKEQLSPRRAPSSETWHFCILVVQKVCVSAHNSHQRDFSDKDRSISEVFGKPKYDSTVEKPPEDHGECMS